MPEVHRRRRYRLSNPKTADGTDYPQSTCQSHGRPCLYTQSRTASLNSAPKEGNCPECYTSAALPGICGYESGTACTVAGHNPHINAVHKIPNCPRTCSEACNLSYSDSVSDIVFSMWKRYSQVNAGGNFQYIIDTHILGGKRFRVLACKRTSNVVLPSLMLTCLSQGCM